MKIMDICVYEQIKYFVICNWVTCDYERESNSYIVEKGNKFNLVLVSKLQTPWPLPMYTSKTVKLIINRACHFGSGYTFDEY